MTVPPPRYNRRTAREHFSHTWLDRGGAEGDLSGLNGWTCPQMLRQWSPAPVTPEPADLVPARANGQPAFGAYPRVPAGIRHATGLYVLTLAGDRICAMTRFEASVLPWFGLPRSLAGGECAVQYQSLSKIPGPSAAAGRTQAAGGAAATGGNPATPGPLSPTAVPLWAAPDPVRQRDTG